MTKWLVLIVSAAAVVWVIVTIPPTLTYEEQRMVLADLKKDPTIKDVAFETSGADLWVGVLDNGTDRTGYAGYVCEVVRSAIRQSNGHHSGRINVKVMDIGATAQKQPPRELGQMWCDL